MKFRTALLGGIGSVLIAALAAQAQVPGVNSTLASVFTLAYDNSTMKPTYSASAMITPASSATDVCTLSGSATKTVKLRRIFFTGITTSTVATNPVLVYKRSTAATTGTSALLTKVPYDSASAASGAVAESYTANPTVGTAVGLLAERQYTFALTTSVVVPTLEFKWGELGSPVVLRGTSQNVAVNLNGATVAGPITCTFEWTEDSDS